jgi:hypothetical protein
MRCNAVRLASSPASTAGGRLAFGRVTTDSLSQRISRAVSTDGGVFAGASPGGNTFASTSSTCSALCWSWLNAGACAPAAADSTSHAHATVTL